jgi:hypothetical protein
MRKLICFAVSHFILARWRNHFSQLLNVHGFIDVRQTEIHTAKPVVTEPSAFEADLGIVKLKSHKSPGIDQILTELFKAWRRTIRSEFHKRITSIWNKEELPDERKDSIIVLYLCIRRAIKKMYVKRPITSPTRYKIVSNTVL